MSKETLHIKNMVCDRCIMVVQQQLEALGYPPVQTRLGEVTLAQSLPVEEKQKIASHLQGFGFELIDDRKHKIVAQVKGHILHVVRQGDHPLSHNLSAYLNGQLHLEYNYISTIFAEIAGTTIEKFFIAQKIELVKELLAYGELTLSEIAHQLHYSSVSHLSGQFKQVTGLTPTQYKQQKTKDRTPLDKV